MTNVPNVTFDSISHVFRELADRPRAKGSRAQSKDHPPSPSWCDWSYDETCKRGNAGGDFPEFRNTTTLPSVPTDKLPLTIGDDWAETEALCGGYVDLDLFFEGDPECMMAEEELPTEGKALRFGVSVGGSCMVDSKAFKNRAKVLIAYIEQLELRGITTELWVVMAVGDKSGFGMADLRASMAVCVKQCGETLRQEAIAFVLDPSFFRRVFLKYMETEADLNDLTQSGYGFPQVGATKREAVFGYIAPAVDHWIPEIDTRGSEFETIEGTIATLSPIFNRDWS